MALESILGFAKDYWLALIIGLVVIGYIAYTELKRKKKLKAKQAAKLNKEVIVEPEKTIVNIPPPYLAPETPAPVPAPAPLKVEDEFDFDETDEDNNNNKKDIIEQMNKISGDIVIEKEDMDEETQAEYFDLQKNLTMTSNKKTRMLKEAQTLKSLYTKYKSREEYLRVTIKNIEKIVKTKATERQEAEMRSNGQQTQ
jgi:hypothetical protein